MYGVFCEGLATTVNPLLRAGQRAVAGVHSIALVVTTAACRTHLGAEKKNCRSKAGDHLVACEYLRRHGEHDKRPGATAQNDDRTEA